MADITFKEFEHMFKPTFAKYKRDRIWNVKVTDQNSRILMCDTFGDYRHARVSDLKDRKVIAWWIEAHNLRIVVENTDATIITNNFE